MSILAIVLVWLGIGCLLFGIALQLDLMEIRWERRNRERAERWEADQRGSAPVSEFKQWQEKKNQDAA